MCATPVVFFGAPSPVRAVDLLMAMAGSLAQPASHSALQSLSWMLTLRLNCFLRSGEEGYYPELTEFCEKRLALLAPRSRALRKDKPAATSSSFSAEEWEKIDSDLKVERLSLAAC